MLEPKYRKRSFLKLPVTIDTQALVKEFHSIPKNLWTSSYWGNVHCSIGTILLRGGNSGTESDFYCDQVYDHPILSTLPYINQLISPDGPFGGAKYAFIFRMIPNGVTLVHQDLREEWFDKYRVHVPIITNDEAVLISDKRCMHLSPGEAWTFDNYSLHGVVNGKSERAHLIFDVPFNPTMAACIDGAEVHKGFIDEEKLKTITRKDKIIQSYPGDAALIETIRTFKSYGWSYAKIAENLNIKGIPTKHYGGKWDEESVSKLLPAIFM